MAAAQRRARFGAGGEQIIYGDNRKMSIRRELLTSLLLAVIGPAGIACGNTLNIDYYTIAASDQDANHLAGGNFDNEVQNALGPHGLPVLNTAAFGCTSNCFPYNPGGGAPADVLADGEITYWSPTLNNGGAGGTSDVTLTGSQTVNLPFNVPANFFPPNGTGSGDGPGNGYQAAVLTGTLDAPSTESISFSIGADDMAFAFLDGKEVCDLGGVHGSSAGTCVSPFDISAGAHDLDVFFVDINQVQSGLSFDVITSGVTTSGGGSTAPEPSSFYLAGIGLAMLLVVQQRRRRKPHL